MLPNNHPFRGLIEPVQTDTNRYDWVVDGSAPIKASLGHSQKLLRWLQEPGGKTGTITATELRAIYVEMCTELQLMPLSWIPVGRELRRLTMSGKIYAYINGRRTCIYRIPEAC